MAPFLAFSGLASGQNGVVTTPDMKARSRVVTVGSEATTSGGMLCAVGTGDRDWDDPQMARGVHAGGG
jgi:hypothetical protein